MKPNLYRFAPFFVFILLLGPAVGAQCPDSDSDGEPGSGSGNLLVTEAAAMESACGLHVNFLTNSRNFLKDNSPSSETVYRASFLFDPSNLDLIEPTAVAIAEASGTIDGEVGVPFRLVLFKNKNGAHKIWVRVTGREQGLFRFTSALRIALPGEIPPPGRACMEWVAGLRDSGGIARFTYVGLNEACPTSTSEYREITVNSSKWVVNGFRLGQARTPAGNGFNDGSFAYYDAFESFRTTLTP